MLKHFFRVPTLDSMTVNNMRFILSDNRFVLGVGVGWMKEEFDVYGVDFHKRGKITDEMIEVLHKLWNGEMVQSSSRIRIHRAR